MHVIIIIETVNIIKMKYDVEYIKVEPINSCYLFL